VSLSRRDVRRLRAAGWEVIETGPGARVRAALRWLITGRRPVPSVTAVRTPQEWSR
jgi:hypothetical protein